MTRWEKRDPKGRLLLPLLGVWSGFLVVLLWGICPVSWACSGGNPFYGQPCPQWTSPFLVVIRARLGQTLPV